MFQISRYYLISETENVKRDDQLKTGQVFRVYKT